MGDGEGECEGECRRPKCHARQNIGQWSAHQCSSRYPMKTFSLRTKREKERKNILSCCALSFYSCITTFSASFFAILDRLRVNPFCLVFKLGSFLMREKKHQRNKLVVPFSLFLQTIEKKATGIGFDCHVIVNKTKQLRSTH